MAQEETEIKKKQNKKTQQPLRMQSRPSPSLNAFLCLFHAVWFSCFLLSLLLVAVLLIWQQLTLPGRGGPPSPPAPEGLHTSAAAATLHFPLRCLPGGSWGTQPPLVPARQAVGLGLGALGYRGSPSLSLNI